MTRTITAHACKGSHRAYYSLAACAWKNAVWVGGEGPWALLAHCGDLSVMLYPTEEAAQTAKVQIDNFGCGHACHGAHEIVRLRLGRDECDP